jgi:hypothetical protein
MRPRSRCERDETAKEHAARDLRSNKHDGGCSESHVLREPPQYSPARGLNDCSDDKHTREASARVPGRKTWRPQSCLIHRVPEYRAFAENCLDRRYASISQSGLKMVVFIAAGSTKPGQRPIAVTQSRRSAVIREPIQMAIEGMSTRGLLFPQLSRRA